MITQYQFYHDKSVYFGPRRGPFDPPVFAFLFAGSFLLLPLSDFRLLLFGVEGNTLKKLSRRPCVDVVRVFMIFLTPERMRSSLN